MVEIGRYDGISSEKSQLTPSLEVSFFSNVGGESVSNSRQYPSPNRVSIDDSRDTKVDRNRHKGCTMEKATKQGIRTAQLPLADYIAMGSYSRVLTARIQAVVEGMVREIAPEKSSKCGDNFLDLNVHLVHSSFCF